MNISTDNIYFIPVNTTLFQQVELLPRTTCFGTCVPSSDPVSSYNYSSFIHSFIHSSVHLEPFFGTWLLFQFLKFYAVGRTPWTGDQPIASPLSAHRTARTQNKRTQTSIPQAGFERTIPVFERTKTVHVLDRKATAIGTIILTQRKFST
jgi:hypothetical protein